MRGVIRFQVGGDSRRAADRSMADAVASLRGMFLDVANPPFSLYTAKSQPEFLGWCHERQIAGARPLQWLENNAFVRVDVGRHHAHLVGDRRQSKHARLLHSHRPGLHVRLLLVFRQTGDRQHARSTGERAGSPRTIQDRPRAIGEGRQADAAHLHRPHHEPQRVRDGAQRTTRGGLLHARHPTDA